MLDDRTETLLSNKGNVVHLKDKGCYELGGVLAHVLQLKSTVEVTYFVLN
jgi:hypothetical protein